MPSLYFLACQFAFSILLKHVSSNIRLPHQGISRIFSFLKVEVESILRFILDFVDFGKSYEILPTFGTTIGNNCRCFYVQHVMCYSKDKYPSLVPFGYRALNHVDSVHVRIYILFSIFQISLFITKYNILKQIYNNMKTLPTYKWSLSLYIYSIV